MISLDLLLMETEGYLKPSLRSFGRKAALLGLVKRLQRLRRWRWDRELLERS